jgi:methylated-DNA-[protein]-cysteine S-methyltransferase
MTFRELVLAVVRRIPPGRVASYGEVAAMAGRPRAARSVGNIMRSCAATDVPCHRVVAAGGRLGGFGGNLSMKRELLRAEGVIVVGNRLKEIQRVRWKAPGGPERTSLRDPSAWRRRLPGVSPCLLPCQPPTRRCR